MLLTIVPGWVGDVARPPYLFTDSQDKEQVKEQRYRTKEIVWFGTEWQPGQEGFDLFSIEGGKIANAREDSS